ncbi:MAG TPA: hypothetical protein VIX12_02490 [Candidatus Binataceae bacterium]
MSSGTRTATGRGGWLFASLLISYCAIYAIFYPQTYSIFDESYILTLAYSIAHGTIYPDHAGPDSGLLIGAHEVAVYSPFHAAMLAPAFAFDWRVAFLVTGSFFVLGAFILRNLLLRSGLSPDWSVLYFLLAGPLYYSQTLMAAVPAAVMSLWAIAMLLRPDPRPFLGGLAFGASVLLHPWMAPMAVVFSAVWCLERAPLQLARNADWIAMGAFPSVAALAGYNYLTTGNPFVNAYTILRHQYSFVGAHFFSFFPFYLASLAVFPLGGWAIFSRRWSQCYALPITAAVMVLLASLYYFRDGLNVGSAQVGTMLGVLAGIVPGQRFLLPVSMIACVPAARFLDPRLHEMSPAIRRALRPFALAAFALGFVILSAAHQAYLGAHAKVQRALLARISANAQVVVGEDLRKEMAPVRVVYSDVREAGAEADPPAAAYVAWLGAPGALPPKGWFEGRREELVTVRSWVWNRDLWVGDPIARAASAAR